MTQDTTIPDLEARKQAITQLRESNRQLELVALAFEELIAMVESDLRRQRRDRLEKRATQTCKS
ncbi:hypothetical protein [Merismopedia glauca]|uniref:Uncharacterized protein n=1 Tax=Merismopedia glauca CCAP 1448/3 TaxID=1296344 RepID=A0A2T1C0R2_9CYAN|nr:hypothetical protein [Merismopedia glauca]PSB01713.1 hypothetical protein C7B64_16915 [Merismopedia glauca CCAP 1448/3]